MSLYRILAIDYGEKRVGIALSDPLRIISKPFCVLENNDDLFDKIQEIIFEQQVEKIVLGIPYNLKGEDSHKTKEVKEFGEKLIIKISLPIIYWDERYSTVEANESLKKMGYSVIEARKVVDKVAASIILKNYLQS
ncbi:MAG: Holliday junction resolvase RuvX [Candidatus Cloacimonetes bacterium]|nr:Holliday junction resolvase RuvX [Candidatus Cloacimonadota bacterium]